MTIDWAIIATIVVIAKGLWDIYKERHQPQVDLSSLEINLANAANISVKTLLDIVARLEIKNADLEKDNVQLKSTDTERITDIHKLGQSIEQLRVQRNSYRNVCRRLFALLSLIDLDEKKKSEVADAYDSYAGLLATDEQRGTTPLSA